jgi:hypothetical protein
MQYYGMVWYGTSRKVADSSPNEVSELPSMCLILSVALGPGVYSASNRNEYQMFLGVMRGRCVGLTALTAICEPIA